MAEENKQNNRTKKELIKDFQKSLVSFLIMIPFLGFFFAFNSIPAFILFAIGIPWAISLIHKGIDIIHADPDPISKEYDLMEDYRPHQKEDKETFDEKLDLNDFKELRKEWKDSDFV
ncbi:hypothetical protein [Membranihabitans marinus]|uniref:hypothetical protein n=1 Tax=Membranihabitans marinus TaxID=1227546 RepID=UPI001F3CF59E|nr:hypothetical protein [Membranihabitans marinus]